MSQCNAPRLLVGPNLKMRYKATRPCHLCCIVCICPFKFILCLCIMWGDFFAAMFLTFLFTFTGLDVCFQILRASINVNIGRACGNRYGRAFFVIFFQWSAIFNKKFKDLQILHI